MPNRFFCDYCDTFLTHDSPSVRKTHCSGRKHKENVRFYYEKWYEDHIASQPNNPNAAAFMMPPPTVDMNNQAADMMSLPRPPLGPPPNLPPELMNMRPPMGPPPMGAPPMVAPPPMGSHPPGPPPNISLAMLRMPPPGMPPPMLPGMPPIPGVPPPNMPPGMAHLYPPPPVSWDRPR